LVFPAPTTTSLFSIILLYFQNYWTELLQLVNTASMEMNTIKDTT
jgi:hypothetical protein